MMEIWELKREPIKLLRLVIGNVFFRQNVFGHALKAEIKKEKKKVRLAGTLAPACNDLETDCILFVLASGKQGRKGGGEKTKKAAGISYTRPRQYHRPGTQRAPR